MKHLFKKVHSLYYHYRKFGKAGLKFDIQKQKAGEGLLSIQLNDFPAPIYMRKHTSDIPMFYYIYAYREMDVVFDFHPEIIIDCGAHIGLSAVLFANRYPDAKIFAIEPEPSNFVMLIKNTKPYPNIICLQKAIWNKKTRMEIKDAGFGNWGYMTSEASDADQNAVESISIPDLMEEYGINKIDICKVNIEGAEKELFEANYKEWISKTKGIIIELHDHMKQGCSASFFSALLNYNFQFSIKGSYVVIKLGTEA